MHRLTPGPFLGSISSRDLPGATFARWANITLSGLCVIAASGVWMGAALGGQGIDIVLATKISSGVLLVTAITSLLLVKQIADMPRLALNKVFDVVTSRLAIGGPADTDTFGQRAGLRGMAGVVEAVFCRIRGQPAGNGHSGALSKGYDSALHEGRQQARQVAAALNREANILADASSEIDAMGSRVTADIETAEGACVLTQASISQVTDHVVSLGEAVRTTTAEAQRVAAIGVGLSDIAFNSLRSVTSLDEQAHAFSQAAEQAERFLQRIGTLGEAASVEAAQSGLPGQTPALNAASIQELSCSALSSITSMHQAVAEMRIQIANAARQAQEIGDGVARLHELGLAVSQAVTQQSEEITAILGAIDEAQTGFTVVRISVQAATRHGTARLAETDILRETAERLPSHAEAIATILRSIPDFDPPIEFGF